MSLNTDYRPNGRQLFKTLVGKFSEKHYVSSSGGKDRQALAIQGSQLSPFGQHFQKINETCDLYFDFYSQPLLYGPLPGNMWHHDFLNFNSCLSFRLVRRL